MLPFFPALYPDELLYSALARYHVWSRNAGYKDTVHDLFGSRTACAIADLPNRLQALYDRLPPGSLNTPDRIIEKHTLFPLYRPFLPQKRAARIRQLMKDGTEGGKIHITIGIMASSLTSPRFLRYCPACLRADTERYGEPYWHRTHQVFGARVCPVHRVWLGDSNVAVSCQPNKHAFHPLDSDPARESAEAVIGVNAAHYLALAGSVHWLLNHEVPVHGLAELRERYICHLQKKNLATYTGRIRQRELMEAFHSFYGPDFLAEMDSAIDYSQNENWLNKLLREPRTTTHPVRHLLFIRFLGLTPEEFLMGKKEQQRPFGRGPWPCLNAAAPHYRRAVVRRCTVTWDYKTGLPVGTFTCACGFTYARRGPDRSENDCYHIGRIKSFGPVWEEELIRLAVTGKQKPKAVARKLNVDPLTVKRHLQRLIGNGKSRPDQNPVPGARMGEINDYRTCWLALMEKFPEKTKTELRRIAPADYAWLYRYDRLWLDEYSPAPAPKKGDDRRVDWQKRDTELAALVTRAAAEMKQQSGKPTRLTVSAIGKKTGKLALLQRHLSKLPKTRAVLDHLIETEEDFQIRRIRCAAAQLRDRGELVRPWKIVREAGLRPGYSLRVAEEIYAEVGKEY
ncbi:MAG: TnsD family transposase [Bacillota bacterium]